MQRSRFSSPVLLSGAALVLVLTGCGGSSDDASTSTDVEVVEEASGQSVVELTDQSAAGAPSGDMGASPFTSVVTCLQEQGIDVEMPEGGPGTPPSGSMPEGAPADGERPTGTPPSGSMPSGSMPEMPAGGPADGGDPTEMLTTMLGLDTSDAEVAAALESCSAELEVPAG